MCVFVCVAASTVPAARTDVVKVIGQHFQDKEIGLSQGKSMMHEYTHTHAHTHTLHAGKQEMAVCV